MKITIFINIKLYKNNVSIFEVWSTPNTLMNRLAVEFGAFLLIINRSLPTKITPKFFQRSLS